MIISKDLRKKIFYFSIPIYLILVYIYSILNVSFVKAESLNELALYSLEWTLLIFIPISILTWIDDIWDSIKSLNINYLYATILAVAISIFIYQPKLFMSLLYSILPLSIYLMYRKKDENRYPPLFTIISLAYVFFAIVHLDAFSKPEDTLDLIFSLSILLFLPILSMVNLSKEASKYIVIFSFRFTIIWMIVNLTLYILLMSNLDLSILSFISLNKQYIPSEDPNMLVLNKTLLWSKYFHPTFMSYALVSIFGFAYLINREGNKYIEKYELFSYFILFISFVFINQSRYGILIAFFCAFLIGLDKFMIFDWCKKNKIKLLTSLISLFIFLFYYFDLYRIIIDGDRYKIYKYTINRWLINPIMGLGTGSGYNMPIDNIDGISHIAHSHNIVLSMLLEHGIFGVLFLLSFSISYIYYAVKNKNNYLIIFAIFTIPFSMIESILWSIHSVAIVFFFISLALWMNKEKKITLY